MTGALETPLDSVGAVLQQGAIRSVFQPIVELDTGRVAAYEALARGPEGPLQRPDALFAAARDDGLLADLDHACRAAAFFGAVDQALVAPLTVFVNVEPEVLDTAPLDDLLSIADLAPGGLRVVLEITERALAARPAELLRTVDRVRELGWGIALDDVGAETMSLAFMPLLRPDVVKLDLRLVQDRPDAAVAEIMNAVNAHAERSGALLLAEGIETEAHLTTARALGATLGQGWMLGRPQRGPAVGRPATELRLPARGATTSAPGGVSEEPTSPFACLPDTVPLRRSSKALLIELSKQLEREAMRLGRSCVVAAAFQEARHLTASTRQRYRDLVERTGFVCALGEGLPVEPLPGLRGATLAEGDPVRGEWDLVVLGPHFSVALLARDLGDDGPDLERTFVYALTYDRDTVVRAARQLLGRVTPRVATSPGTASTGTASPGTASTGTASTGTDRTDTPSTAGTAPDPVAISSSAATALASALGTDDRTTDRTTDALPPATPLGDLSTRDLSLERALAATSSGVTIVDVRLPDQPLVYVNRAFELLSGYPGEQVLGRNCRFLQSPDTDTAVVSGMRAAIAAGEEFRATLLNRRGPEGTPWWNEIHLAPVRDGHGAVVQYIGVQHDVTARVEADRDASRERDRARSRLSRLEQLAYTDPLTGLVNRRRFQEQMDTALWDARAGGTAIALAFLDLNGFKAVNDELGHAAGDELLVLTARRLRSQLRHTDLPARLGGDEFLVAVLGLAPDRAQAEAERIATDLHAAVTAPAVLDGHTRSVGASIGVSVFPHDGDDFWSLLRAADLRMYDQKRASPATEGPVTGAR